MKGRFKALKEQNISACLAVDRPRVQRSGALEKGNLNFSAARESIGQSSSVIIAANATPNIKAFTKINHEWIRRIENGIGELAQH